MTLDRDTEFDVSGKTIAVRLTHWDLVRINLGFMPRLWAAWTAGAVLALAAGIVRLSMPDLGSVSRAGLVVLGAVALLATFASMAGFLAAVAIALSTPYHSLLGEHTYTFQADGLHERSSAKDTLIQWGRVQAVRRLRGFILIMVAPGSCHAVPRRAFASRGEYQAFWRAAQRLARGAAVTAG
jgi:hypothetical protein